MKIWKKTLALVMALGMTAGFAACGGGKGDKEPAGEQLQGEGAWAAAWEATLTATNVTIEGSYSYSFYAEENIWSTMDSEGTIELADGKVYTEGSYTQEYDYSGQGHDKGEYSGVTKCYTGMQDGVLYDWFYDEETKEWDQEIAHYDADTFGTAFGLVESNFEVEMDRYDYLAWEALAVYEDGVYTLSFADEDDFEKYQFKFVDGKLYSFDITMTEVEEEGYTSTISQSYVVSYGDAKVGKLPYEEGFENEKTEEGGDVGGGTVGGEEIGGESVLGENVETLEEWNTIYANSCAQTNIVGVQTGQMLGQQSTTNLSIQDGKVYMVNVDSVSGTRYRYVGFVEGVQYSWTSFDNATWSWYEETDAMPLTAEYVLSDLAGVPFDKLTYDEERGVMVYSGVEDGQKGTVEIKIVDGKIVSYSMFVYDDNEEIVYSSVNTISYGTATVGELPPLENGSDSGNVGGGVVDPNPSNPDNGKEEIDNGNSNVDFGGNGKEEDDNNAILK
ncbi:MAG: MliC family protein [Clostridia bacterium]|nr:MliC family protein [Clostridia bacterium]